MVSSNRSSCSSESGLRAKKALLPPALPRRKCRFTVRQCVISAQELTEALVKIRERKRRLASHDAAVDVPWQSTEEHLTEYTKEALDFPFSIPRLMIGYTDDGEADGVLIAARNQKLGISTAERR
jgi:hypothetical protein